MGDTSLRACGAAALLLMGVLGSCTYWSGDFDRLVDESGRDFSRDPGRRYTDVEFEKILQSPAAYVRMDVRFWALLNRREEEVFFPMYSTFLPEEDYAFSLWPVSARLWEEAGRLRSLPTVYIRKDNPDLPKVIGAPRYALVQCRGRVEGEFDSGDPKWGRIPFICVHYFDVAAGGPAYDDETLRNLASGLEDLAQKRPAEARRKLEKAIQGTLQLPAWSLALAKLGLIHEEAGTFDLAVECYELALEADPDNAEAREGLERAGKALQRKRAILEGGTK